MVNIYNSFALQTTSFITLLRYNQENPRAWEFPPIDYRLNVASICLLLGFIVRTTFKRSLIKY